MRHIYKKISGIITVILCFLYATQNTTYKFNEATYNTLKDKGVKECAVYFYTEKQYSGEKAMLKRAFSILLCVILVCTAFVGCGNKKEKFVIPNGLLTEDGYRAEVKQLLEKENFSNADTAAIDKLGDRLKDMIVYNTTDITECKGTTYYISNGGDDKNDGKSRETAWATLEKLNGEPLNDGDLVLFERGGFWRGHLYAKSGVTYSAYGEGHKPKIYTSIDGTEGEWTETDTPDVYVYSKRIFKEDVCVISFGEDNNAKYAEKKDYVGVIKQDLDFAFQGARAQGGKKDSRLYLKCEEGNPKDVFDTIEISYAQSSIQIDKGSKNIHINNMALIYGSTPYSGAYYDNIKTSYCVMGWHGGNFDADGVRFCGGVGVLPDGDHIYVEHCYIYQQFDSGVTPQVAWSTITNGEEPSVFDTFVTTDCLFEFCEYTLEYFSTQKDTLDNAIKSMYFGYNFCRLGGYGFGDKVGASRYIKSWSHENTCIDCTVEYNIFDRAASQSIEVISYDQFESGNKITWENIPKFNNNVYIHRKDRSFANVNNVKYKFNEETYKTLEQLGFETGARYFYAEY